MPKLPLGRLFWKFLIFFFLAQTTAVLGIGLAIWATMPAHETWAPPPPPLDWLSGGEVTDTGKVEDVPMALVLYPAGANRDSIAETLKALGYQLVCTDNQKEAQERMRFVRFACIVYQADMHGSLDASSFHASMCAMSMEHRRHIFYILTSDNLRTLYDLEALAVSANLTVHSKDRPKLHIVLRKAFQAHEELFGPLLEELGIHSKN